MNHLQVDQIYRLKVLVLGDKGVGKTSLILTFLHGRPPSILPHNEDFCFYTKQQDYSLPKDPNKHYECRFHIWDISGSVCNHQTFAKFKQQRFYQTTAAFVYVFRDEPSFQFLKKSVFNGIPPLEITSKQSQFLIYNPFRDQFSLSLEEKAKALAPREYTYMKLQPSDVTDVKKLFENILEYFMFKVNEGIITNGNLRDRDNNVVLRGRQNKEKFERKYNRCC